MVAKNFIEAIPLTSINANTFTGNYQAVNGTGTPEACTLIRFTNDTTVDVTISFDGVTPHDYLRTGDKLELNLQANSQPSNYASSLKQGSVVYVAAAGGTGLLYFAGYYNSKS